MDDLLATKLFVPRPPAGLVPRPRLSDKLDDGLRRGLTLVVAPAGFGKTSLLAEWITRLDLPVAWLSLDAGDNDPVRFWRHVAHSLDRAGADLAAQVEPMLAASGPAFDRVVTAIVNGLAAGSTGLVLVLDDYHVIESDLVHDTVQVLLENLPPDVPVVVAGRSDPPIPLARRRAGGRLAEVRVADLRFTAEEAADLLRRLAGPATALSDDAVATLAIRTEGWAVGLQLAALSLQGSTDVAGMVASFSGTHRYILDYLTEEVLAHQPVEIQEFLLDTSVLGRLSGPLCAVVTGRTDAQDMLEIIERANLFLVPLDAVRGWWRYHHLFRDLLYARMRQQRPERVQQLHRSAAVWHQENGLIDDAITHALAAGDAESAARVVERHADEYLNFGEDATLKRWLHVLPAEAVAAQPRLLVTKARLAVMSGRVAEGGELLDAAERAYPDAADVPYEPSVGLSAGPLANVPAIIAVNRAFIANLHGDPDTASEFARQALGALGEDEWMLDSLANAHLAVARWARGSPGEAEGTMQSIIDGWLARGVLDYATLWSYILGRIQSAHGRLGAAAATYERALTLDGTTGSAQRPAAGAVLVGAAELGYQRNDLDTAEGHLAVALPLCRELGYTQPLAVGLAVRALIRHARGDVVGAGAGMTEAVAASPAAVIDIHNPVPAMQARLWLRSGEVDAAARWIAERGLDVDDKPDYPREPAYLVLARILVRQNRLAEALRLLDQLHTSAAEDHRRGSVIEIQVLRSLALAEVDDDGAIAALAEALELAHPEGYVRVFADEGQPMAAVLGRFAATGAASAAVPADYLGRLIRECGRTGGVPGSGPALLSDRELEVLRLMAVGRANREIAVELFISPHTVKRHVAHILDKLGAGNRTEAGARARDLGLLD